MNRKKIIFLIVLAASIIIFAFLIYDFYSSKRNIYQIEETHAKTIINTLNSDFKHTLEANTELEDLIINQLSTSTALIEHLERSNKPEIRKIRAIADENEISSISYLDKSGNLIISTDEKIVSKKPSIDFLNDFNTLRNSDSKMLDLGVIESPFSKVKMYFLLRKRANNTGYLLVGIGNKKLIELRRSFGIGAKIAEFIKNDEIAYIVLQDENGIYAASSNLAELSSIEQDEQLLDAIIKKEEVIRKTEFQGKIVLEVAKAFQLGEESTMLTRVGLRLDKIDEIEKDAFEKNILAGFLTFITFIIVLIYILTRQKLINLGIEHKKIQSYFQVLLENVADGVIALDDDHNIIVFNDAAQKALEINKASSLGRKYSEVFEIDLFNINEAITNQTSITQSSIKYTSPKSNIHYLTFTTNAAYNFDELDSVLIFIRDITEQVKIQKQIEIREKQAAISQLASGIAHEIRNPLNAIYIIIQRFQIEFQTVKENEEFQKLLKTIRNEIVRINEIIEQFLDFSRPQQIVLEKTDVSELMDEIVSLIENLAIRKQIEIHKNYKKFIFTHIDPKKIKQVLLNLTQNAFDAMPRGGDLVLSILQDEVSTKIRITDSGEGISDELKSKIFSLYFTTKKNGHGLGLAIVHQIVTDHNGEISVQSSEGSGSTFEISIPNNF
jgi:signal transduction histidine kinase